MRKTMIGSLMLLALSALAAQAWAGDYLKIRHVSEAYEVMGQKQPATEEIVETWLSGDLARMNTSPDTSVIFRGDKEAIYLLDHAKKAYTEMPLNMASAMTEMMGDQGADAEMTQMMTQMMGAMMEVKAGVVDTGATKAVNNWTCRLYELTLEMPMGKTVSEICATEEIGVDLSIYHKVGNAMMAGQPGFAAVIQEMEKIKGVSVLTISKASIMGAVITSREELMEHRKLSPPDGTFDIPSGYTKQTFTDM